MNIGRVDDTGELALLDDGTVTEWGDSTLGEGVPNGLANVKQVAAGYSHGLALSSGGLVTAWGGDDDTDPAIEDRI